MTKIEFLKALRKGLRGIAPEDVERLAGFYNEMIEDRMEEGMSEAEAVAALGGLDEIVASIRQEYPVEPTPKKRLRWPWILGAVMLGIMLMIAVLAYLLSVRDDRYEREVSNSISRQEGTHWGKEYVEQQYTQEASSIRKISVNTIMDDVEIFPATDGELKVQYYENQELWYEIRQEGSTLWIEQRSNQINHSRMDDTINLRIYLPAEISQLGVSTVSGDIELNDLTLTDTVYLSAVSGDIELERCTLEDVDITNVSGDVDGEMDVQKGRISTTSGEVDLKLLGDASDYTLSMQTISGKTPVSVGGGSRQLRIETVSGDVKTEYITQWDD